jgi:hypothetical protein
MVLGFASIDRGLPLQTIPHADGQRTILAVDVVGGTITVDLNPAKTPTIYNLAIPLANTEASQLLSDNTKSILIRARIGATLRLSFSPGGTNTNWITIPPGATYSENNLSLQTTTIYLQSSKPSQVIEILEWT